MQEHSVVNKETAEEILKETTNPNKVVESARVEHEQEKENMEAMSQPESSQEIAESNEGIILEEYIQGHMNIEEEPQE